MTENRWQFIINPAAGGGHAGKKWDRYEQALRSAGVMFDVVFTEKKGHATELAKVAAGKGYRRIAAVGGDGTAHEVANGILSQTDCPPEDVTFALLPVGTGNDWIREHRIPKNFRQWLPFFLAKKTTLQDVGRMTFYRDGQPEMRFFINVAGLAYDGFVARAGASGTSALPAKLFYLWLIFRCLFQFKLPRARVQFNGQIVRNRFYTINAGICRYSGGGLQLVPHALPADGKLALTLVKRVSKLEVLLCTPLFYLGKIGWHPAVSMFQTEEVKVEALAGETILAEADGEFLGEGPVEIGILSKKLRVLSG